MSNYQEEMAEGFWGRFMSLGGLPILFILLILFAQHLHFLNKEIWIDDRLDNGLPSVRLNRSMTVDRPDELRIINERFIKKSDVNMFGVILGPSGTGKTYLTRLASSLWPSGVLYYEIFDPLRLPEELAETVGMRLRDDANLLDVLFEKLGISSLVNFYTLPKDLSSRLSYVLEVVAKRAVVFKGRRGWVPCIIIDGVDLLAKEDSKVFVELVDRAKYLANTGSLLLVLCSEESLVLPLLDNTSSTNRKADVVEILDIDFVRSKQYLIEVGGIPVDLVEGIFNITGGRIVYLNKAIELYAINHKSGLGEKDFFCLMESSLVRPFFLTKFNSAVFDYSKGIVTEIMNRVLSEDAIDQDKWTLQMNELEGKAMKEALKGLIALNLLRFRVADGLVTWHSQVVYYGMKAFNANELLKDCYFR